MTPISCGPLYASISHYLLIVNKDSLLKMKTTIQSKTKDKSLLNNEQNTLYPVATEYIALSKETWPALITKFMCTNSKISHILVIAYRVKMRLMGSRSSQYYLREFQGNVRTFQEGWNQRFGGLGLQCELSVCTSLLSI